MRGFWRHGISERVTGLNRASADALSRINRFLWRSGAERESPNSPRIILFYFAADASSLSLHPYLASLSLRLPGARTDAILLGRVL